VWLNAVTPRWDFPNGAFAIVRFLSKLVYIVDQVLSGWDAFTCAPGTAVFFESYLLV